MPAAAAVNYYVSSSGGDDSNDGLSPATAWRTLAKASSLKYVPNSIINLKCGDTWAETLYLHGGGTIAGSDPTYVGSSWAIVQSYGTGAKPLLDGGNTVGFGIRFDRANNTPGWKLVGIEVKRYRYGIYMDRPPLSNVGLWLEDMYIHDCDSAPVYPATSNEVPVWVWCSTGLAIAGARNIVIKSCIVTQCDLGVYMNSYDTCTVDNLLTDHCYRGGAWFTCGENIANWGYPYTQFANNLLIKNSRFTWSGYLKGMTWGTAGLQLNGGGPNLVVQDTEIDNTQAPNSSSDGVGLDIEVHCTGAIIQRCNIHDNYDAAFLLWEHDAIPRQGGPDVTISGLQVLDCTLTNNGVHGSNVALARNFLVESTNAWVFSGNTITKTGPTQKLFNNDGTITDTPRAWWAWGVPNANTIL